MGSTFAGYELGRLLAVGEIGAVYAAKSRKHGPVAVKLIHPTLARELGPALADVARVSNEVAHHRVPKVIETTTLDGVPAMIVALIDGESVADLIRRRKGRVPPAEALRIASDALEVLAQAHRNGIAHGALTARHLVLSDDGDVHVLGFGESRLRALAKLPGSAVYSVPESPDGPKNGSSAGDIWSLGAVLFALLTGVSAFGGPVDEEGPYSRRRTLRSLGGVSEHAPRALTDLVDRTLSLETWNRFPDAKTLLAAMRTVGMRRDVHYAYALGSALAPESSNQPMLDIARMTAPPISPVLGSSPYTPRSTERRATTEFDGAPRNTENAETPQVAAREAKPVHETLESWLTPTSVVVTTSANPTAHTIPVPVEPKVTSSPPRASGRADTHPALPLGQLSPPSLRRRREADMTLGIVTTGEAETDALEGITTALEHAVAEHQAEGESRDEEAAALDALCKSMDQALESTPSGLTCRVRADSLETGLRPVWRAPGALEGAVRALHRGGIDTLAFLPGLEPDEIGRFVQILAHANTSSEHDDAVSELYDADFSSIVFCAPNLLAAVEESTRSGLEGERRRLLALLSFDTSFQLEDAWQAAHGLDSSISELDANVKGLAAALPELSASDVGLQLELEMELTAERLGGVVQSALEAEGFDQAITTFGAPMRARLDALGARDPLAALELIDSLAGALQVPEAELDDRRRALGKALVSSSLVSELFGRLAARGVPPEELGALLPLLGVDHCEALARALGSVADLQLRAKILHHLELGVTNHETELGRVAGDAEPGLARDLVQLLTRIDTLRAKEGLDLAAKSHHVAVRLEALGAREGASGERLRQELKRLLEEATPQARIIALRAIADTEVRAAAPFVALRARSPDFDDFPREERRAILNALTILAPARAETLCIELLQKKGPLLGGSAHEESRALAAEALGRIASSDEAIEVLSELAKSRWGASDVREAASEALEHARARVPENAPDDGKGGKR